MPHAIAADMRRCIEDCSDCLNICLESVTHCLELGGRHAAPDHLQALLDCVSTCRTAGETMLRGSQLHGRACGLCAEACARCATSCESFADSALMRQCAEACRRCEASCRVMAGLTVV